jgi:glycosyltransferase involved in cell wall biosynthesis
MRVVIVGSDPDYLVNLRGSLVADFVRGGHEVHCMSPGDPDGWQARAIQTLGARFEAVAMVRQAIRPTADLRTLWWLTHRFRTLRPDLVFSYTMKPVVYGSMAARWAGVPRRAALIPGLGQMFTSPGISGTAKRAMATLLYRHSLRSVDPVFLQNREDAAFLKEAGVISDTQRVVVVDGSGVDIERFEPVSLPADPSFLFVARLVEEKGVADFVEVARRVRRRIPRTNFRIVGYFDGRDETKLRPVLENAAQEGVVELVGRVTDIRPELARSTAMVLPSRYREGIPRSLLEAMAMGRPIVTTDWVGCRETVRTGENMNGILVPTRDIDALERAVVRLAEDPSLARRMGQESRRYVEERFDVRRVNRAIFEGLGLPFPPIAAGVRSAVSRL